MHKGEAAWAAGLQRGGGTRRVDAVETSNSISALKQGVMMEPELRNDAQGEGCLMRRGSDMGGQFAESRNYVMNNEPINKSLPYHV